MTRSAPTRSPRCTTSWPTSSAFEPTRNRTATYDLLVVGDCGVAGPDRRCPWPARRAVRAAAARRHRPPRLERMPPARSTGSTRPPRRRARWSPCCDPAWRSARCRRRRPRRCPDGRDRHGHGHVRAPERDATHPARRRGAGGSGRAPVRHLSPAVSHQADGAAPAVRTGARPDRWRRRRARDLVDAARRGPRRHRDAPAALGGHHRPARAGRRSRGGHPVQGGRQVDPDQRSNEARGRGRHGADRAFGGGGHARAAGATVDLPVDQARPAVLAEAARLAAEVAR